MVHTYDATTRGRHLASWTQKGTRCRCNVPVWSFWFLLEAGTAEQVTADQPVDGWRWCWVRRDWTRTGGAHLSTWWENRGRLTFRQQKHWTTYQYYSYAKVCESMVEISAPLHSNMSTWADVQKGAVSASCWKMINQTFKSRMKLTVLLKIKVVLFFFPQWLSEIWTYYNDSINNNTSILPRKFKNATLRIHNRYKRQFNYAFRGI